MDRRLYCTVQYGQAAAKRENFDKPRDCACLLSGMSANTFQVSPNQFRTVRYMLRGPVATNSRTIETTKVGTGHTDTDTQTYCR